ncbi:MAG TPA: dethiobiotin synthase, partial [Rhodospirillaceae bacterium]|nr:dethiobiotin synthase [Rhodospirillaceae bacterium]
MTGVFVTGTGTGVGKTLVAAWLVRSWAADYWKPVQSGTTEGWDAEEIRRAAPAATVHPSRHALAAALSPDQAAERQGLRIELGDFQPPPTSRPLVVEGAGGVLVPLNDRHLMVDLMRRLALPVVLVASGTLGTINHSLLSLEALRRRRLAVAGVIVSGAAEDANCR